MPARRTRISSGTRAAYNLTGNAAARSPGEARLINDALAVIESQAAKRGEKFLDPQSAGEYFKLRLHGEAREHFDVAFLDSRHRLIACERLFSGTIDGAEVHPREVAKRALYHNAAAILLAHNHPSGNPEPSAADRAVTVRLRQALSLLEVRVIDHFIIGDGTPTSMAQRGMI